jgi:hypothetical protein
VEGKEILYIVPSRGRPDKVADLISSWVATRSVANLLIVVDDDDPLKEEYFRVRDNNSSLPWLTFACGPRLRLGPTLNEHAAAWAPYFSSIGFMGDDHRPRTPIWDGLMASQLRRMRGGIVYPNDLYQKENLPTSVLMSSFIISDLGYMCPPGVIHMYLDNFWKDLGRDCGFLRYMDNVVVEHVHPAAGKAPMDAMYAEVNSDEQFQSDFQAYDKYLDSKFQQDVTKLMGKRA